MTCTVCGLLVVMIIDNKLDHNRWIRFETGAHGDEDNFDGPGGRKRCKRLENN